MHKAGLLDTDFGLNTASHHTHRQVLEGVRSHGGVCSEQVVVQLVGGPLHDGCVHAILHCQHGTHSSAKLALEPLKQGLPQALHHMIWAVMSFPFSRCYSKGNPEQVGDTR